jgi:putative CocE/NonD family hydrolase
VDDPADPVPTVGGSNLPLGLKAGPWDQSRIESREDVLVFTSEPLGRRLAVCGEIRVVLTVSVDRVDADLAVRVSDVGADGRSMLVADSIRRLKLRDSTARPSPLTPGEPVRASVVLPPTAITFMPGHRIRVSVSGSNHPRYEQNSHTGADRFDPDAAVPAEITLHFGPDAAATVHLPIRG